MLVSYLPIDINWVTRFVVRHPQLKSVLAHDMEAAPIKGAKLIFWCVRYDNWKISNHEWRTFITLMKRDASDYSVPVRCQIFSLGISDRAFSASYNFYFILLKIIEIETNRQRQDRIHWSSSSDSMTQYPKAPGSSLSLYSISPSITCWMISSRTADLFSLNSTMTRYLPLKREDWKDTMPKLLPAWGALNLTRSELSGKHNWEIPQYRPRQRLPLLTSFWGTSCQGAEMNVSWPFYCESRRP